MAIDGVLPWMRAGGDGARAAGSRLESLAVAVGKSRDAVRGTLGEAGAAMSWQGRIVDRADAASSAHQDLLLRLATSAQSAARALHGFAGDLDEHSARIRALEHEHDQPPRATWPVPQGPEPFNPWLVSAQARLERECAAEVEALVEADRHCASQVSACVSDLQALSAPGTGPEWTKSLVPADLWSLFESHLEVSAALAGVDQAPVDGYAIGPAQRPPMTFDDGFPYDTEDATLADYVAKAKWQAMLAAGRVGRPELDDALAMYAHYWDNDGTPMTFDYDEAAQEDPAVQATIDAEVARSSAAVDAMVAAGNTEFSFSGAAHPSTAYPVTENWQKTIGAYQQWSSGDVRVEDGRITMTITVHAEDRYNFNPGQADIETDAPDDENGRFSLIGWARPFQTSGSVTRTISWNVGDAPPTSVGDGEPDRDPGGEDRVDR